MAINEELANRIRELLSDLPAVEEKKMFQSLCFMVNDKMCFCVNSKEILCRIGQDMALVELENGHCRQMTHNGKTMKDYLFVDDLSIQKQSELQHW